MPVLRGRKSDAERFPGAVETFTIEALMRDGKALQSGTSHFFGQGFARAYDVRYTGRDGAEHHPYSTSWGASTRLVGGLIMAHGDESGLRLPPAVAPHQVVIVAIARGDAEAAAVGERAAAIAAALREAGVRVRVDDRPDVRPGFKFNEWELRGAPLRLELGPRDLTAGQAALARRDTGAKEQVALDAVARRAPELLAEIQAGLLEDARAFRAAHTIEPSGYGELREFLSAAGGFARAPWCGSAACEERVKAEARATIRCLPLEAEPGRGPCVVCGAPATDVATWAQAY
jgi:prolyl-tRNA synthetase